MIVKGIVSKFGRLIRIAEKEIIQGIEERRIETEPSITDRFLGHLEYVINHSEDVQGIVFRARTLRDRGINAPESRYGADFCAVLHIRTPEFRQTKGFLSQAKIGWNSIRRGARGLVAINFSQNAETGRLNSQIDKMLAITPDSFVFIYSNAGFFVIPASSIRGLRSNAEVYGKPVSRFFKEFLMCFIGDHRLSAYDDDTLEKLRIRTESRTAIIFQVLSREYL